MYTLWLQISMSATLPACPAVTRPASTRTEATDAAVAVSTLLTPMDAPATASKDFLVSWGASVV